MVNGLYCHSLRRSATRSYPKLSLQRWVCAHLHIPQTKTTTTTTTATSTVTETHLRMHRHTTDHPPHIGIFSFRMDVKIMKKSISFEYSCFLKLWKMKTEKLPVLRKPRATKMTRCIQNHSLRSKSLSMLGSYFPGLSELPLRNRHLLLLAGPFPRFFVFSISLGTLSIFCLFSYFVSCACVYSEHGTAGESGTVVGVSECWRVEAEGCNEHGRIFRA